ncbi:hypothetical protein [Saliterribacillus persicus]|uniref:Uncharacterized protein n=1 Tax=Saliterribacillus persicus TaxID=930114 RepID=A0A368XBS0_9BACI|nr:hypothetical protein [Saliterribacillus persicus]RCW63887.1 hypothetical protein DFR57_11512 [Saliterribacillus persicus]
MRKSVGIFLGAFIGSFILFMILSNFFQVDGGNPLEPIVLAIGTVIILLLCYLVTLIHYLIKQQSHSRNTNT